MTRDSLVETAKAIAKRNGKAILSKAEFVRNSGISDYHIYRLFPEGGWLEVVRLAGLERNPLYNEAISDQAIMVEFHRVISQLGAVPSWPRFAAHSNISDSTVRRRFGGLEGTLRRYGKWLAEHEPDSPLREVVGNRSTHEISAPGPVFADAGRYSARWAKADGVEYGEPISFRGLRHAPINEQGVVYLFGMVSYELGYLVEAVHTAFPDCEAKRCVDSRRNRWQRVRIEFEFRSSNFLEHNHDPSGCELIVCWQHDWLDCPLEVLELRSVIKTLDG